MFELAIVSGKGGTGKTTVSASFSVLAKNKIIADCDVDAPDLHLLLKPKVNIKKDFFGMKKAYINKDSCIECGVCIDVCRFDAISPDYIVDTALCEGCEVCFTQCPVKVIEMRENKAGEYFVSETPYGKMVHGILGVGEENSGKLVAIIRNVARYYAQKEKVDYIIVDGPPGIGCPVNSTLSGLKYAVGVTEPTESGLSDLERLIELFHHFKIKPFIIINKSDLNSEMSEKIKRKSIEEGAIFLGEIPFDPVVVESLKMGKPVVIYEKDSKAKKIITELWKKIEDYLSRKV